MFAPSRRSFKEAKAIEDSQFSHGGQVALRRTHPLAGAGAGDFGASCFQESDPSLTVKGLGMSWYLDMDHVSL